MRSAVISEERVFFIFRVEEIRTWLAALKIYFVSDFDSNQWQSPHTM
jgi:hypothetical protein